MISTVLPLQLTSFIGRKREIAEVQRLFFTSPLITLTGAGSSGKTWLAVQLARQVREDYPDGVHFVDLVPLREPGLVAQLVVETLGLHLTPDQPLLEALISFIREKRLLLILDNCEHLSEACARWCTPATS